MKKYALKCYFWVTLCAFMIFGLHNAFGVGFYEGMAPLFTKSSNVDKFYAIIETDQPDSVLDSLSSFPVMNEINNDGDILLIKVYGRPVDITPAITLAATEATKQGVNVKIKIVNGFS